MRTTITLEDDVAAAVHALRRSEGMGLSEAVNELIRRGLTRGGASAPPEYQPRSAPLGIRIDVTHIADVLDVLDDERASHAS